MIRLTAKMQAKTGKEQKLETVLRELVKATATEEGSLEYRLHRIVDAPGTFRFIEKFKDQAAFDFHSTSAHFKTAIAQIGELTEGDGEFEMLELVDSIPE
ncbi:putative quinol monooxygenase [Maridesulfovibrio sp.]|uniref:putative quinol monooxygenase n=1 Tax=Maridesulfovibrio sp. TaxID=2795000 RepID=UPI0039EFF003